MHRLFKLGLAAAVVVGGVGSTLAEDVTAQVGAAAGTVVDATTTGSIGGSFDTLLGTMNTGVSADLSAVTDASTVNFVTISSMSGDDPMKLDEAISTKTDAMASMRASIEANAALKAKLEAAGYSVEDVLWIETGADGAFTVYIDDRA